MARKPLHIPWNVLMSDTEGPAPTVEIVPSGGAAATGSDPGRQGSNLSGETFSLEGLTDHELEEKIERVRKLIASEVKARLLDKGAKLQANLQGLEKELEWRRSLPRANKDKDEEGSREIKQLIGRSPTDSSQKLSPDASSSNSGCFAHHFSKLLDAKVDHANQDAFNEELSVMCKGHSTGFNEIDRKRRKSLESHGSLALKLRKQAVQVLDVVVLDEDAQAVEPMQEQDDTIEQLTSPTKEAKIFYPSRDHPECVEIFHSDIKCLEPASYLSSTIMNFYIQYLQNSVAFSEKPKGEYHFCNTYFYSKLEEAISHKGEVDKHLAKLRRWWKGINIFDKAYIFLPIHKDMHWSLVIICIPDREDESGPIILHLDSLGFHASRMIFGNIERYLKEEWTYLNEEVCLLDLPFSEKWRNLPLRIDKKRIMVPQQKNVYDCGLFVLYFIERFIDAAPARLKRKDLAMFGSKWFHPEEASGLRKRLKKLIIKEFAKLENHETEPSELHISCLED